MKIIFISLFFIFSMIIPLFANWEKNTITAVIDLSVSSSITGVDSKDLSELVQSELVRKHSFDVVERGQIERVIDEQKLQLSGLTEAGAAMKLGSLLGADKIITGSFSKLGNNYFLVIKGIDTKSGEVEYSEECSFNSLDSLQVAVHRISERFVDNTKGANNDSEIIIPKHKPDNNNEENNEVNNDQVNNYENNTNTENSVINNNGLYTLKNMIKKKDFLDNRNIPEMQGYSEQMPSDFRDAIYDKYRIGFGWPIVGNIVPGLGSFLQGDIIGGIIEASGFYSTIILFSISASQNNSTGKTVWGSLAIGFYAYGFAEPAIYAGIYNGHLKSSLEVSQEQYIAPPGPGRETVTANLFRFNF